MRSGNLENYYFFVAYSTYAKHPNQTSHVAEEPLKCATVHEMCGMIEPLLALHRAHGFRVHAGSHFVKKLPTPGIFVPMEADGRAVA